MGAHIDAPAGQHLLGHSARKHQRCSQAAGKMTAAAVVVAAMITHMAGIVGVTRTRQILGSGVVLGMLVAVADNGTERRPGGPAFK